MPSRSTCVSLVIKWFLRLTGTAKRIWQHSLSAKQDFLGLSYFLKAFGGALKVLQCHERELDDTPAISLLLSQCGIVKAVMLHDALQSPNITEHLSVLQAKILHSQLLTIALMKAFTCSSLLILLNHCGLPALCSGKLKFSKLHPP